MKVRVFRLNCILGVSQLLLLMLAICSNSSSARVLDIYVSPEQPTSVDTVVISVGGAFSDACFVVQSVNFSGAGSNFSVSVIAEDMWEPGMVCALILVPYGLQRAVGPLAPGTYHIGVSEYFNSQRDFPDSDSFTFEVDSAEASDAHGHPEISLSPAVVSSFPNPFNASTQIEFDLPASGEVTLSIFDITGLLVTTLIHESLPPGRHSATFDGHDLASGLYFARLQSGENYSTHKMVLLK